MSLSDQPSGLGANHTAAGTPANKARRTIGVDRIRAVAAGSIDMRARSTTDPYGLTHVRALALLLLTWVGSTVLRPSATEL